MSLEEESDHALAMALATAEEEDAAAAAAAEAPQTNEDRDLALSLLDEPAPPTLLTLTPMKPSVPEPQEPAFFSRFVSSLYSLPNVFQLSSLPAAPSAPVSAPIKVTKMEILEVMQLPEIATIPHQQPHNELIVVLKPDGSPPEQVYLPLTQQQFQPVCLPYSGLDLVPNECGDGLVDFYSLKPEEIFIPVFSLETLKYGLELIERSQGVFIRSGCSADPTFASTKLRGGDLLVEVANRFPIANLGDLTMALQEWEALGECEDLIELRVLRKPTFVARCPNAGHALKEPKHAIHRDECFKCHNHWAFVTCEECQFSLCKECFIKVEHARNHPPMGYVEVSNPSRLSFSELDVGMIVLVFWPNLLQWAVGRIEAYDLVKGHMVLYPEFQSREMVLNFGLREYRVLASEERQEVTMLPQQKEQPQKSLDLMQFEMAMSLEEGKERILLTEQELGLLNESGGAEASNVKELLPASLDTLVTDDEEEEEEEKDLGKAEGEEKEDEEDEITEDSLENDSDDGEVDIKEMDSISNRESDTGNLDKGEDFKQAADQDSKQAVDGDGDFKQATDGDQV
ncbi:hypothetical protein BASA81_008853 [Batrachochytrium salamandrivorans]|nr:hypothetical protein BASA81_008853 [Batrachochytrium salamandrivorans]